MARRAECSLNNSSPHRQTDVVDVDGKMILVATVQRGRNKPYKDLAGHIWVKQGADKRRVTENSELLSLFQDSGEYHADEASVKDTSMRETAGDS